MLHIGGRASSPSVVFSRFECFCLHLLLCISLQRCHACCCACACAQQHRTQLVFRLATHRHARYSAVPVLLSGRPMLLGGLPSAGSSSTSPVSALWHARTASRIPSAVGRLSVSRESAARTVARSAPSAGMRWNTLGSSSTGSGSRPRRPSRMLSRLLSSGKNALPVSTCSRGVEGDEIRGTRAAASHARRNAVSWRGAMLHEQLFVDRRSSAASATHRRQQKLQHSAHEGSTSKRGESIEHGQQQEAGACLKDDDR